MKLSVGYQLRADSGLIETIKENRDKISEIYFSFGDFPNGRNTVGFSDGMNRLEAAEKQKAELEELKGCGIGFNLLLNGNCYGKNALSRAFFCKIGDTVEYLSSLLGLECVTTTSPLIAKFIKQNFPEIRTRASVNIGIESADGMDYIAEWFDSFYLKREYNRDFERLKQMRSWCDKNGKGLYGLANSGCLNHCSAHTFHDNLVSHEDEISEMDNAYRFEGQCHTYLKREEKRKQWLRITNFIRPEDVGMYEPYFDGIKLATRVNKNPCAVIRAYARGSFDGAVTSILEPDHSALFYPFVVDNKKIDRDFAMKTASCNKNCSSCGFCIETLENALTRLGEF